MINSGIHFFFPLNYKGWKWQIKWESVEHFTYYLKNFVNTSMILIFVISWTNPPIRLNSLNRQTMVVTSLCSMWKQKVSTSFNCTKTLKSKSNKPIKKRTIYTRKNQIDWLYCWLMEKIMNLLMGPWNTIKIVFCWEFP